MRLIYSVLFGFFCALLNKTKGSNNQIVISYQFAIRNNVGHHINNSNQSRTNKHEEVKTKDNK